MMPFNLGTSHYAGDTFNLTLDLGDIFPFDPESDHILYRYVNLALKAMSREWTKSRHSNRIKIANPLK
jgi:hypothetical protein